MAQFKDTKIDDTGFLKVFQGTSSQRPGNAQQGSVFFNTDTQLLEYYDNDYNQWLPTGVVLPKASGGDSIQDVNINGVDYRIHAFTSTGTSTFTVTRSGLIDVLVVAGGGAGGTQRAAGGGAGGLVFDMNVNVTPGSYSIVVGDGNTNSTRRAGSQSSSIFNASAKGEDSSAFGYTAIGGGNGAGDDYYGLQGGSGGGGADDSSRAGPGIALQPGTNPNALIDAGFNGGDGRGTNQKAGAGGGGASEPGQSNQDDFARQRAGGDGLDMAAFFTTAYGDNGYFAGGGGGNLANSGGLEGVGGLGGGADPDLHAMPNTGGGGGGGEFSSADTSGRTGGNGGSGIVLIRYRISYQS